MPKHSESTLAAIKNSVDIATLVGEYLTLQRAGSKYKALCPFHDDHNPSLLIDPERQSFKCWSCGAGGDIFDFVKTYERVDFPEALRMLAERAGLVLERPDARSDSGSSVVGPSKSDLLETAAWAERSFFAAFAESSQARDYASGRGITAESVARFRIGYAPDSRDWLQTRARRDRIPLDRLERTGLLVAHPDSPGLVRDRFRGRLIFPIRDFLGRTIAFGGRILPELEKKAADENRRVAKYLNSPETVLFQKRRTLFAADLARPEARALGWVAVVEGYTDVVAAHQAGLTNVVGTLGTALGDDHIAGLRRLADRVVLVFDGDEAGRKAADRALEIFLGHEIDTRVLTLPDGLDPCDFLLDRGADSFRTLVEAAIDPLDYAIDRAAEEYDFDSVEGARRAAESVVGLLGRLPKTTKAGLDVKVAKALDRLATRLRVPVEELQRLHARSRTARPSRPVAAPNLNVGSEPPLPLNLSGLSARRAIDLDPLDRELTRIILNDPSVVPFLITRVTPESLRDESPRAILRACYDCLGEGLPVTFDSIAPRLDESTRTLAAELLLPLDPTPLPDAVQPASWRDRLAGVLESLALRERRDRLRELKGALEETDALSRPEDYQALKREWRKLLNQRPNTRRTTAS